MKRIKIFTLSLLLLVLTTTSAVYVTYNYYNAPLDSSLTANFTITKGTTLRSIAGLLKKEGHIRNSNFFIFLAYYHKLSNLQIGSYSIEKGSSSLDILHKLSKGSIITVSITIPEGFNIYAIADRFDAKGICAKEKFLFYAFNRKFLESLQITGPSAEGYLFPETYSFAPKSDARFVIKHLHATMIAELKDLNYQKYMAKNLNLHKLLILASLIEKEAQIKSEQQRVASVFHNRIRKNMRFDSDPTVRYAVKKFKGRIRYSDLESNSPYNTYRISGYPPGPIASPGRAALYAALHPETSKFLYFVARNNGSHYFSKTLSQHNRAVEYYQKNMSNGFIDDQL